MPDNLLAGMSLGNTAGCAIVFAIVWYKRLKYNKQHLVGDLTKEFSTLTDTFTVGENGFEKTQLVSQFEKKEPNSNSALFTDNKN